MASSTAVQRPVPAPVYLPPPHRGATESARHLAYDDDDVAMQTCNSCVYRLTHILIHYPGAVVPVDPAVAVDAVTISFVTERSDANGVRTVDVVRALQSDTIQDVKLRLRTRGHRVSNGHALVSTSVTCKPADRASPLWLATI